MYVSSSGAAETYREPSKLQQKLRVASVAAHRTIDMLFDGSPIQEMSRRQGWRTFFMEGHMDGVQYEWFKRLFSTHLIQSVVQTGFNAGHSAFAFANLGANRVTSFDINEHSYVLPAHEYLLSRFPKTQFELVLGDSRETVPEHPVAPPHDLAFIDGGHSRDVALSDLAGLSHLVRPGGYLVMDDYGGSLPWQIEPTIAYDQAISDGLVTPIDTVRTERSGWALGQYRAQL
jgi:hypothetical protein